MHASINPYLLQMSSYSERRAVDENAQATLYEAVVHVPHWLATAKTDDATRKLSFLVSPPIRCNVTQGEPF